MYGVHVDVDINVDLDVDLGRYHIVKSNLQSKQRSRELIITIYLLAT